MRCFSHSITLPQPTALVDGVVVILEDSLLGVREGSCARARRGEQPRRGEGRGAEDRDEEKGGDRGHLGMQGCGVVPAFRRSDGVLRNGHL